MTELLEADNRLSLLELKCRRPVEHVLAGEYHSVFRGQGIEFEDVRRYQPGDDVRAMDWKVTARTGEPHIKRYVEQREQFLYLLVDMSASVLDAVAGRKREMVTELCALLTMIAVRNNDRVSLILFTDRVEMVIPPGSGRRHALRIMDALLNFQPEGRTTQFTEVLSRFGHLARKHSVVFVLSDFLASDYLEELRALACRHDVSAINVLEPSTMSAPIDELVRMEDTETGERRFVDLRSATNPKSRVQKQEHHIDLQEQMLQCGISLMEIAVNEDCVSALSGFFHSRQRRIADETGG
ncbi:Protein of unknown function DUF58 [Neorhodopirellula lusitana]|uniref:VWFA domain-containing protein n=1 Tax=Neorhodopirellula lusitana TaxID=445327 RepID=A0ABY1PXK6_9BACT|nr:DUF58 domain-containing protein [Neorhodopirellula lusitana]SMP51180.1 Protein of unknown function DUF58 [Neorhodopirellula lusitana]